MLTTLRYHCHDCHWRRMPVPLSILGIKQEARTTTSDSTLFVQVENFLCGLCNRILLLW